MALNGPPNPDVMVGVGQDFSSLSPAPGDPQCSPTPGTVSITVSPPASDSPSLSPGPVSPGKKRVRISDSASVRVIEDHHHPRDRNFRFKDDDDEDNVRSSTTTTTTTNNNHNNNNNSYSLPSSNSPRSRRELKFNATDSVEGANRGSSSPRIRDYHHHHHHHHHHQQEEDREYRQREYYDGEYQEYRESIVTVDQLTFPDQVPPTPVEKSLESRDNPFLPGGDLSKEAEELLKKATIVRDKFYLNQDGQLVPHRTPDYHDSPPTAHHPTSGSTHNAHHAADGTLPANVNNNNANAAAVAVLEERISPKVQAAAAAAAPVPRENGKAGDGVVGGTSPDGVRLEVGGSSPTADGSKGVGSDSAAPGGGGDQQDKDKAKRRPKCCSVM